MQRSARLSNAAFALVGITWALLVFGASVRVHGAGLACPDWPLCFGQVIPAIDFGVGLEFGHRVLAGLVSLGWLGLGLGVFRGYGRLARAVWAFGSVALAVQVVLGGLTVLELLAEWTVTSHLLGGNTFCLSVLVLGLALRGEEDGWPALEPVGFGARSAWVALALLLPVQLALGGLVSSSHAGLVCPSWPACAGGVWVPTLEGLVGLQVAHRFVGYGLAAAALAAFAQGLGNPSLRAPSVAVFALVLAQIALGVANVLARLPVEVTLAHTGTAAGIVLATTWLGWRVLRAPSPAGAGALMEAR